MKKLLVILSLAVMVASSPPALADDGHKDRGEHGGNSHNDKEAEGLRSLLRARRSGLILPLFVILRMVHPITGDDIVDVEFEQDGNIVKYGIYFLNAQGVRQEVYVDARTGEVLEIKKVVDEHARTGD